MLSKSRADLSAAIPKTADTGNLAQNPCMVQLTEQLKKLDDIKNEKDAVMGKATKTLESFSAVEDFMAVNNGQA